MLGEGGQLVDGQAWPSLCLALLSRLVRPLLTQAGELQVVEAVAPVLFLGFLGLVECLARLDQQVIVAERFALGLCLAVGVRRLGNHLVHVVLRCPHGHAVAAFDDDAGPQL
ncbi:MAG TPA: hypothetical protein PLL72_00275 [Burkholderiaceae bacterium]|nr:hypothetical protein [Burkholderiaceae bacterium]